MQNKFAMAVAASFLLVVPGVASAQDSAVAASIGIVLNDGTTSFSVDDAGIGGQIDGTVGTFNSSIAIGSSAVSAGASTATTATTSAGSTVVVGSAPTVSMTPDSSGYTTSISFGASDDVLGRLAALEGGLEELEQFLDEEVARIEALIDTSIAEFCENAEVGFTLATTPFRTTSGTGGAEIGQVVFNNHPWNGVTAVAVDVDGTISLVCAG